MEYYWLDDYSNKKQEKIRLGLLQQFKQYLRVDQANLRFSRDKALSAVSCFLCNTTRTVNKGKREISISLDAGIFCRTINGKKGGKISYRYTRPLIDFMVYKGYIELEKGGVESWTLTPTGEFVPNETASSKITILPPLVELLYPYLHTDRKWQIDNVLILRDSEGNDKQFKLTKRLKEIIRMLNETNKILINCELTLDGEVLADMQMRRIFNTDFSSGGRFYAEHGVVQCESQEDRLNLCINGEPIVELDYSNLHPRLAYSRIGMELPDDFDCYHIENWEDFGTNYDSVRSLAKLALLVAINCYDRRDAAQAVTFEYLKGKEAGKFPGIHSNVHIYKLLDALILLHHPIADQVIYGGFGPQFQYEDSCLSEYVYNHFNLKKEPVLCIHDSYIVRESMESELREVMYKAYEYVAGDSTNCKVDKK